MSVAVFGLGYWGPNLVRNFLAHQDVDHVIACDISEARSAQASSRFRGAEVDSNWQRVLGRADVEAVAIATPVHNHFDLARAALKAGKHVMVAKPFTRTVAEADELIDLAQKKGLCLMVDHTYLFTPAVRKIKSLLDEGALGELLYFDSVRVNLGLFQSDVNVIWDLAPHDLSILKYLIPERPKSITAVGMSHYCTQQNIAYLTLSYDRLIAHFHVNWVSPVKVRTVNIGGTKQLVNFDDTRADDKIRVYDKGVAVHSLEREYELQVQYRSGDMFAPRLDRYEALGASTRHFLDCCRSGNQPLSDGQFARDIIEVLEAADQSLRQGGGSVALSNQISSQSSAAA